MLPEVQAFFTARQTAQRTYEENLRKASDDNPVPHWHHNMTPEQSDAYRKADTARFTAVRAVEDKRRADDDAAMKGLEVATEDKLVRWIAQNVNLRSYTEHVETTLRALPMTREALDEFGQLNGWCGEWERFLEMAEQADVLPPYLNSHINVEGLTNAIYNDFGGRRPHIRKIIRAHLPEMVASAHTHLDIPGLVEHLYSYEMDSREEYRDAILQFIKTDNQASQASQDTPSEV